jgi:hypothetical protein
VELCRLLAYSNGKLIKTMSWRVSAKLRCQNRQTEHGNHKGTNFNSADLDVLNLFKKRASKGGRASLSTQINQILRSHMQCKESVDAKRWLKIIDLSNPGSGCTLPRTGIEQCVIVLPDFNMWLYFYTCVKSSPQKSRFSTSRVRQRYYGFKI